MANRFTIASKSNMRTLELIAKGFNTAKAIAKERKISPAGQHFAVKQLEKHGYIKVIRKGGFKELILTQEAKDILSVAQSQHLTPITLRIHKSEVRFKLKDTLSPTEAPYIAMRHGLLYKNVKMKNHNDAILYSFKLKARLYPNALVIYGPEIEALPDEATVIDLVNRQLDAIEEVAWDIESRMEIKLKKLDRNTLIGKLVDQHIAIKNCPWARWFREHGSRFIIEDPDGGEPLLEMDFSHNIDETESHNLNRGEASIQRATDLLEATAKGEITAEGIKTTERIIKEQNQFFIKHNKLIDEIRELIIELRKERKG